MFMRFKRQQVDLSNQLEFSQAGGVAEGDVSCARTTPVFFKKGPHPSHIASEK